MNLIVYDFETNEEYKLDKVKSNRLNYSFENVKREYLKEQRRAKRFTQLICSGAFAFSIFLLAKACTTGNLRAIFHDRDNLFKNNQILATDEEVDEICNYLEKQLGVTIEEENKDEYLLLDAINKNKNLTEEEKKFCYKYIDIFLDNPYLNKESVYYSLLNLDISYDNRPSYLDPRISATFNVLPIDINVYSDNEEKSALSHELIHCIFNNQSVVNLPRFFYEGMTELLNNEYFSTNPYYEPSSYPYEICVIKMLCEATSADTVLKAYTYCDMSYITDEIAQYIGSEEANQVIDIFSTVLDDYLYQKEFSYSEDDVYDKCISKLNSCVHDKFLNDDKACDITAYYYNETLFKTIGFIDYGYLDYIEHSGVKSIGYFSKKLIEKNTNNDNTKVLTK